MRKYLNALSAVLLAAGALLASALCAPAHAAITGITGADVNIGGVNYKQFNFTAKGGYVYIADGSSLYFWGYADGAGRAQYPGPTLIVNQGDNVRITLTNTLPENVSIVFPGQPDVAAQGGVVGKMTREAASGGSVNYWFTATEPGTYYYHSGTRSDIHIDMGLFGALIVRPTMGMDLAYNHMDSAYDYEALFLLSEMDPNLHYMAETVGLANATTKNYWATYWFINGRAAPDTMFPDMVPWLPYQPYGAMPVMVPGSKMLMRVINASRNPHPFHHHGNHARLIARHGRLLSSGPGMGADLSFEQFTVSSMPGATDDAIFEWTGKNLGWDIYGTGPGYDHTCDDMDPVDGYDDTTSEWCADHGKPFPVTLPQGLDLTNGGFYSGSPFLGAAGALPPGDGGLNPNGGYTYMWHSHTEKELINNDIFPGGMMTMLMVEPPGTVMMGMPK